MSPPHDPLDGLTPKTAAILCYIPWIGWIGAVIVLASKKFKQDRNVRFHAFQGLYLFATWLLVSWMGPAFNNTHTVRPDIIIEALLVAVGVFMMVKASHEETYVLPIIGELARRSVTEQ